MANATDGRQFVIELLSQNTPTATFIVSTIELIARDKRVLPSDIGEFKQRLFEGKVNTGPEVANLYNAFVRESVYTHSPIWKEEPSSTEKGQRVARYRGMLEQLLRAMMR